MKTSLRLIELARYLETGTVSPLGVAQLLRAEAHGIAPDLPSLHPQIPASEIAVELAAAWCGRTFPDKSEAMLALELAFQAAIEAGMKAQKYSELIP